MFSDCSSLTSLDLSGFDTSKVTDMNHMFTNCFKLTSLDVSNFTFVEGGNFYDVFWSVGYSIYAETGEKVVVTVASDEGFILGDDGYYYYYDEEVSSNSISIETPSSNF